MENRRILIVDDDEKIQQTYRDILIPRTDLDLDEEGNALFEPIVADGHPLSENYELTVCGNGEAAVGAVKDALHRETPFAVAFVDMKMPGMDGAQTAARLWTLDPDLHIVIVTAYSDYNLQQIKATAGRDDLFFLRKPFYPEEISQFARSLTRTWDMEQLLRRHNEILEKTVAERTELLRYANQRKNDFLKYFSHEMNTPLNWIGSAALIDRAAVSPDDGQWLSLIEQGFQRISEFVGRVISYFDFVEQEFKLKQKKVGIKNELNSVLEDKKKKLDEKCVRIRMEIPDEVQVQADMDHFRSILHTLVDNAIMFSDPGGEIELRMHFNDAGHPELRVRDQGRGIPPEHLERIFTPFANLEHMRHQGVGFGLSLPRAHIIAQVHGWQLRSHSDGPGQGAEFRLTMGPGAR